ncbi:MAG: hypothetical protein M3Z37_08690 [Candidatus Eremiobacteraeota bacterium]|nr:hypothetical protein [Candidatus Eremiobacteraeota bacterium]
MTVQDTSSRRRRASVALALVALMAAVLFVGARPAPAADSGIQFDEVTKLVGKDDRPQPGTFAPDWQAAIAAAQRQAAATNSMSQQHGFFSMIKNAVNVGKSTVDLMKNGIPSTEYYLGKWRRTDDPGAQTAVISKPDQRQIIYLKLAAKTYRIVDTTSGPPQTMVLPSAPQGTAGTPPPSPQPGSGKLDVTVSETNLGQKTIENVATQGYALTFKATLTKSTGSCKDGSFQTSVTQYVSNYPEPGAGMTGKPSMAMSAQRPPELSGVPWGCKPTVAMHKSGGGQMPSGRLSMWMLLGLGGSANTSQGQVSGGFQSLIERGNVRQLGARDANLFNIPPGFTKETPSPAPSP